MKTQAYKHKNKKLRNALKNIWKRSSNKSIFVNDISGNVANCSLVLLAFYSVRTGYFSSNVKNTVLNIKRRRPTGVAVASAESRRTDAVLSICAAGARVAVSAVSTWLCYILT